MLFNEQQLRQTIRQEIQKVASDNVYQLSTIPAHAHTGSDSLPVSFGNLTNRQWLVTDTLFGTNPATSGNYSVFFTAPFSLVVTAISEVHTTKGTDSSAVTLNVEKLTGTTAPGSGSNILTTAFDLKGSNNTVQNGALSTIIATTNLAANDRLALVLNGTPTSVANVVVSCLLTF